ncbi:MAG: methyltransferase family protein [Solirubrobacterales bacterium]
MALVALLAYVAFLLVTFGGKSIAMKRRIGSTGFHGMSEEEGPIERFAGVLIILGSVGALVAPVLQLTGVVEPFGTLNAGWVGWAGLILALLGWVVFLVSQAEMGESWRIGVEPGERTELVTEGLFAYSRNPFFAAVFIFALGLFLMVPNPIAVAAGLCLFLGFQIQVRTVEEPNLREVFGEDYVRYGERVGRYLPGIGRFRRVS